jgi:twitching motility protein PilT
MGGGGSAPASMAKSTIRLGTSIRNELPINKLFRAMIDINGSDLHLQVGKPAILRVKGALKPLDMPLITEDQMKEWCMPMMDERNTEIFFLTGGADYAHIVEHKGELWRFRVNLFIQTGKMGMVSRKTSKGCSCRRSWKSFVSMTKGWCCWPG